MPITYKDSGVDTGAAERFVQGIRPLMQGTFTSAVFSSAAGGAFGYGAGGGFASGFRIPAGYKNPVLFACTDGVGTKLSLAKDLDRLGTIGTDLVAMCVNDLLCAFATPLVFLDYYACSTLDVRQAQLVLESIAAACHRAGVALIGGETAQLPGFYARGGLELAGFAVGVAESSDFERAATIKSGDVLIALPSSGLHSNGFSLARKVFFEHLKMRPHEPFLGSTLLDVLLEPTRIYTAEFERAKAQIKALAHITGGGMAHNLSRVLPPELGAQIDERALRIPDVFGALAKHVERQEMFRTFNMGVGMILVASKTLADDVCAKTGGYVIGELTSSATGVCIC